MLEFLKEFVRNEILWSAILSWVLAQVVKTFIHLIAKMAYIHFVIWRIQLPDILD